MWVMTRINSTTDMNANNAIVKGGLFLVKIELADGTKILFDGEKATVNGKSKPVFPFNGGLFVRIKGNNVRVK